MPPYSPLARGRSFDFTDLIEELLCTLQRVSSCHWGLLPATLLSNWPMRGNENKCSDRGDRREFGIGFEGIMTNAQDCHQIMECIEFNA